MDIEQTGMLKVFLDAGFTTIEGKGKDFLCQTFICVTEQSARGLLADMKGMNPGKQLRGEWRVNTVYLY